jgi:hypothetical protein
MTTALDIALEYHQAWAAKDVERSLAFLAADVVCDAPAGRLEGVAAFEEFLHRYNQLFLGADLLASFGDEQTAVLIYDNHTRPVPHAPAAARYTITDGKISALQLIFDRLPYEQAKAAAAQR